MSIDIAFDILYVGDTSVIHRSLKERQEILQEVVKPIKGRLEILVPNGGLNAHRPSGNGALRFNRLLVIVFFCMLHILFNNNGCFNLLKFLVILRSVCGFVSMRCSCQEPKLLHLSSSQPGNMWASTMVSCCELCYIVQTQEYVPRNVTSIVHPIIKLIAEIWNLYNSRKHLRSSLVLDVHVPPISKNYTSLLSFLW